MQQDKKSFSKLLFAELAIIALLVCGYFFTDIKNFVFTTNALELDSNCSLNSGICTQMLPDGAIITAAIMPKEILPLQNIVLNINGLNISSANVSMVGVNMDMGEHKISLQKVNDSNFSAKFILPSCSANMEWKLNLFIVHNNMNYKIKYSLWSKN